MVRPLKDRIVKFKPDVCFFKPRGIPMRNLEEVMLTVDEREAIRLADLGGLSHEEAGEQMGVSRATFGRIVNRARTIIADALINGKAIRVDGGNYRILPEDRIFCCKGCGCNWHEPRGKGLPGLCPKCHDKNIFRLAEKEADSLKK